ncbi:unnamed protein product [Musa acuminata subsp. malaccensis]|uniref:(wild Malaysian banana) hypothetical protein n=1 Tax=Musa acuminata subsp. malaccensis TaxID=214687 RepID=A0A804JF28_MUSAM|nr:unnamed protein product [Musa acuminata subsp. malaccensis]
MANASQDEEDGPAGSPGAEQRAIPPLPFAPLPRRSRLSGSGLLASPFPVGNCTSFRTIRSSNLPLAGGPDGVGTMAPAGDRHGRAASERPPSPQEESFPQRKRSTRIKNLKDREGGVDRPFSSSAPAEAVRPWNLRTRRPADNAPAENGPYRFPSLASVSPSPFAAEKSCPGKEMVGAGSDASEKGKGGRFTISLSREEIAEDFWKIKGMKPPRRPKKRPRNVQRQIEDIFPSSWMLVVAPERYKVNKKIVSSTTKGYVTRSSVYDFEI